MKYEDVFSSDFIKNINNILNVEAIKPKHDFGYSIDIEQILEIAEYKITKENLNNKSGYLKADKKIVYIDNKENKKRQRFTMAHELGHIIQGKSEAARNDDPDNYKYMDKPDEVFANSFAAQFLMPKKLLTNVIDSSINELSINPQKISKDKYQSLLELISSKIEVSFQSLNIRIENLHLFKNSED